MLTRYGPVDPKRRRYQSIASHLNSFLAFLRYTVPAKILGIYIPTGADELEHRTFEVEGLMHSPAATVLGEELLFLLLGATEDEEDLLYLHVCTLISAQGVEVSLDACWDVEHEEFFFELTRCHALTEDVEVSVFDCATQALMDLYVDRWPASSTSAEDDGA